MRLAALAKGNKEFGIYQDADRIGADAAFSLRGRDTYVELFSYQDLSSLGPPAGALANFHLTMSDGTKVSFVDNRPVSHSVTPGSPGKPFRTTLIPRFVIVGHQPFQPDTRITSLTVLVDDAASIFHDPDAFGYATEPERHIDEILSQNQQGAGGLLRGGGQPVIGYFAGRRAVIEAKTSLGNVSVKREVFGNHWDFSSVHIESKIYMRIDLREPASLTPALGDLFALLRFLSIVAGRRQDILELSATVTDDTKGSPLEIYWCMAPMRIDSRFKPERGRLPLNGGLDSAGFVNVLTRWLPPESSRRDSRTRFFGCFAKGSYYDIDRLIGAANVFDILPSDAVPDHAVLTPELEHARKAARELFRSLPGSPERDSVLGTLGRLGHNNLKQKVRHRAKFILESIPERLPDLTTVLDEAVNCRNHYVHGSPPNIDYAAHYIGTVPFLTQLLEFVFAASEFVEAGWDLKAWSETFSALTHPWADCLFRYGDRAAKFKALLARGRK